MVGGGEIRALRGTIFSGALSVFIYMSIAASQIALRQRRERAGEAKPAISMWLFPYLSFAAIAGMAAVLVAMAYTEGQKRDFYFSCITLLVASIAYLVVRQLRQPQSAPSAVP